MSEYLYQIGDKTYVQKPLVWGQTKQLIDLLKTVKIEPPISAMTLLTALGDNLPGAVAIIISEQGKSLKEKNLVSLASDFEECPLEVIVQVFEDFFACNPTALYLEKVKTLIGNVTKDIEKTMETGSKE